MELNYLGRYRSLLYFNALINTPTLVLSNVIVGRLTDAWGNTIPPFDPSVTLLGPNGSDGTPLGSVQVGGSAALSTSNVTVVTKLVSTSAPTTTPSGSAVTTVTYNGQTYYAIDVNETNATTIVDGNGNRFLNLYVSIKLTVAAGKEFSFRQLGFHDSNLSPSAVAKVFAYENVHPQTVNAGEGLTIKLILAF